MAYTDRLDWEVLYYKRSFIQPFYPATIITTGLLYPRTTNASPATEQSFKERLPFREEQQTGILHPKTY